MLFYGVLFIRSVSEKVLNLRNSIPLTPGTQISLRICIGVSFQKYSWIQDFEADFLRA